MKKILVTGGAGFIGSNLCQALAAQPQKYEVWSLDNYSTGSTRNHVENVQYVRGDTSEISKHINLKPDLIYHLGEYSRVEKSYDDTDSVFRSNLNGTLKVFEYARDNYAKIVYAGSSTKFSDDLKAENESPYTWTKSQNTELVKKFGQWFGLKYAITYFYNVYGRNEISNGEYATLIGIFRERMRTGQALTVVAPGTQCRNYTHVNDIVSGLMLVGESGLGDNYGIGAKESYSVFELAEMFGGNIKLLPERKGNRLQAPLVTEKILQLGWQQEHQIIDYIQKMRNNAWKPD